MMLTRWIPLTLLAVCLASGSAFAGNIYQNFSAEFFPPPPPPPEAPTDVEFVAGGAGQDAPAVLAADQGWDGQFLRISYDAQAGQVNTVNFDRVVPAAHDNLNINFDIRVQGPDGAANADGYGFSLVNIANHGAFGTPVPDFAAEEPNLSGSLGVGFDTFNNGENDAPGVDTGALPNSVSLHWDGAIVANSPTNLLMDSDGVTLPDNWLENGNAKSLAINVSSAGKASVDMVDQVTGQVVSAFSDVDLPGYAPYEGRPTFRGRTGGSNSDHDIDNILISTETAGSTTVHLDEPFNRFFVGETPEQMDPVLIGGSAFATSQVGNAPAAHLTNDDPQNSFGIQSGFMRLTTEAGGLQNFMAFDKTSSETGVINASFKFRGTDVASDSADGVSFLLVPTDVYGDSGPVDVTSDDGDGNMWDVAEDPRLAGSFGLGFKTFQDDEIRIRWNGEDVSNIVLKDVDPALENVLVSGVFHDVNVQVTDQGDDSHVLITVLEGNSGETLTVFDDVIAGMQFPAGARPVFGARTGGAADFYDIDNVSVEFVPEPSSVLLLLTGMAMFVARLRRRIR